MKATVNSTLAATLIATFVGVGAWLSGFAKAIWPAHPQMAAFVMTIVVSVLVKQLWPVDVDLTSSPLRINARTRCPLVAVLSEDG